MFRPAKKEDARIADNKYPPTEMKIVPNQFPKIGSDLVKLIANSLPNKDAASLAQACSSLFRSTKPALDDRKLAHYVIVEPSEANKINVIARLDAEPMLVNHKIKQAKDKVGRTIKNKTLFQLAYGAGDDDFCLAMKPAFIKHLGSEQAAIDEMERQCNEMLESEEEYKSKEEKSQTHFDTLLQPVIQAIDTEQFNFGRDANNKLILSSATLAAIGTFREEFAKSQPRVIEKGMHFRYNTLQEALTAFDQASARWNYNDKKCALFDDSVLSTVLSYIPANDAQKFSQGLSFLQKKEEPQSDKRSLALQGGKKFYDVVRGPSFEFVLLGSGIDISWGLARPWRVTSNSADLQFFCQTKTSNLRSLCSQSSHSRSLSV
jgi:hypothetical protein